MSNRKGAKAPPDTSIAAAYIAEQMKDAMKRKSVSTSDLASVTGIERSHIQGFYHGKKLPGPEQLRKIAEVLGVALQDLLPDLDCSCGPNAVGGDSMVNQSALTRKMKLDHVTFTATMDIGIAMARKITSKW